MAMSMKQELINKIQNKTLTPSALMCSPLRWIW